MKLNLNLIAGKMNPDRIIYRNISTLYQFPLQYPVLHDRKNRFKESYLYILEAAAVPETPIFQGHCSILSIGMLPEFYLQSDCDIVCVNPATPLPELFNEI